MKTLLDRGLLICTHRLYCEASLRITQQFTLPHRLNCLSQAKSKARIQSPPAVEPAISCNGSISFEAGANMLASAWSNVMSNGEIGYIATDTGSGYMWRLNAEKTESMLTNDTLAIEGDERIPKLRYRFRPYRRLVPLCNVRTWIRSGRKYRDRHYNTTAFVHKDLPCCMIK